MALKAEIENSLSDEAFISLDFKENPAAKKLLDVIVSVLAEEYIQTAKENPEIFSK